MEMIGITLFLVLFGLIVIGGVSAMAVMFGWLMVHLHKADQRRQRMLNEWVRANGLAWRGRGLEGTYKGMPFVLKHGTQGEHGEHSYLEITMSVRAGSVWNTAGHVYQVGDLRFARNFRPSDEETTRRLSAGYRGRPLAIRDGKMVATTVGHLAAHHIQAALEQAHATYSGIAQHADSYDALAAHLPTEPMVSFVVERLRYLPEAQAPRFAKLLAHRPEPEIQVHLAVLRQEWEQVEGYLQHADGAVAGQALGALFNAGRWRPALQAIDRLESGHSFRRFLYHLNGGIARSPQAFAALVEVAARHPGKEGMKLAIMLCGHLCWLPATEEVAVVKLLAYDNHSVEKEAIKWLSEHATVASVPALREVEARSGLLDPSGDAAARAVRMIQARATGEAGGLALAPQQATAGAVSVSASEGQLSLKDAERRSRQKQLGKH